MRKILILLSALNFMLLSGFSQNYQMPLNGDTTFTTCSGILKDHGGNNNYSDNVNSMVTLIPSVTGSYIKLNFTSVNMETCCDRLLVYSGLSATPSQKIGEYSGTTGFSVISTDPSGAITVVFISDESTNNTGFSANISCETCSKPDIFLSNISLNNNDTVPVNRNFNVTVRVNTDYFNVNSTMNDYILSTTPNVIGSVAWLGTASVSSINSGSFVNVSKSVAIPANTPPGDYYIVIFGEFGFNIDECDEFNNSIAIPIHIEPTVIDLKVNSITILSNTNYTGYYNNGEAINGSVTVSNMGNTSFSGTATCRIWFSNDSILSSDDILVSTNNNTINYGASSNINFNFTPQINFPSGNYYFIVRADADTLINEPNETNNYDFIPFTIDQYYTDLEAFAINNVPSVLYYNTTYTIQAITKNSGRISTGSNFPFEYKLLLSYDTIADPNDIILKTTNVSSNIVINSTLSHSISFTLTNTNLPTGAAYLIFVTDSENRYNENNESNNTIYFPIIYPAPFYDDKPTQISVYTSSYNLSNKIHLGADFTINSQVKNLGNWNKNGTEIGYYISADTIWDASDYLLGTKSVSTLITPLNTISLSNITAMVPPYFSPGNYYILGICDPNNNIIESNEVNNKIIQSVTVSNFAADLTITSISSSGFLCGNGNNTTTIYFSNYGDIAITNFTINLYLSSDTIIDGSDIEIYNNNYSNTLYPGSSDARIINDWPQSNSYPAGSGYLLAIVNKNNSINEYSLINNFKYKSIVVNSSCPIDLYAQSGNVNNGITGSTTSFSFTIKNNGTATATSLNYAYYISSDNIWDGSDQLIYQSTIATLHTGGTQNTGYNYSIPTNYPAGNYYGIMVVDYLNTFSESNETNNIITDLFTITTPQVGPDLAVQNTVHNTLTIGIGTYTGGGNITLKNNGTTTASASNIAVYLSTNNTHSSDDIIIGTFSVGSITAGNTSIVQGWTGFIPMGTLPGNYYLIYFIDYDSLIVEYNESNNISTRAVTLITATNDVKFVLNNFPNDTLFKNIEYTYNYWIKNNGNCSYFHPDVTYYLSSDTIIDAGDFEIGSYTGYTLSPGGSYPLSEDLTISNVIPDGNYYFIFHVDTDSLLNEINELNNFKYIPIFVKTPFPDIELKNYFATSLYSQIASSASYNIGFKSEIRNIGEISASSSNVRFYISNDTIPDISDYVLGTVSGSTLSFSTSYTSRNLYNISNIPVSPGNYYLIQYADPTNTVIELNENNNIRHYPIVVHGMYVDLLTYNNSINGYFSDSVLVQGESVPITSGMRNFGTQNSNLTNLYIVLSNDTIFDGSDQILTSTNNTLSNESGVPFNTNITIPSATIPGNYYILFIADPTNLITESNELNNISYLPIEIIAKKHEFYTKYLSIISDSLVSGNSYSLYGYIFNNGNIYSGISTSWYISSDSLFNSGDISIGSNSTVQLNPMANSVISKNITIPAGTTSDWYYLLGVTDPTNTYNETNEANNTSYKKVYVLSNETDVSINHLTSLNLFSGGSASINYEVSNLNITPVSALQIQLFLSLDSTISTSTDILLGQKILTTIAEYSTYSSNPFTLTFPNVTPGIYYLIYEADYPNFLNETDESNNIAVVLVEILSPANDIYPTELSSTTNSYPGATTTISYALNNNFVGPHTFSCAVYLSADTILNSADELINQFTYIANTGYNSSTASITIPGNYITGFYYLIFNTDEGNLISENNELNNSIYKPIYIESTTILNAATIGNQSTYICNGTIFDAGGNDLPYFNATQSKVVLVPSTANTKIKLDFLYLMTEHCCNYLKIYDGPDTLSPLLGNFTSNPGPVVSSHNTGRLTLIIETDSTNISAGFAANISCVIPGIDLTVENLIVNPDPINDNTSTTVEFDIANYGSTPSIATNAKIYLSTDTSYSTSDVLYGTVSIASLTAFDSDHYSYMITPNVTMTGMYYIIVIVDQDLLISEINENNNTAWEDLYINNADNSYDVSLGTCSVSSLNIVKNTTFDINVELINSFNTIGLHEFNTYISNDTNLTAGDLLLDNYTVSGINSASNFTFSRNILMPNVTPGMYYLLLFEDSNYDYIELNESNNLKYFYIEVLSASSIDEESNNPYSIHPNPANESFYILYSGNDNPQNQTIFIYDVSGKLIETVSGYSFTRGRSELINIKNFSNGVYYIKTGEENNNQLMKLIIAK